MAARHRVDLRTALVNGNMHGDFERRAAFAGELASGKIELDQLRFGHQSKRTPRRDQETLGPWNARADVTEPLRDAEVSQHPAGSEHFGAQFRARRKFHEATRR